MSDLAKQRKAVRKKKRKKKKKKKRKKRASNPFVAPARRRPRFDQPTRPANESGSWPERGHRNQPPLFFFSSPSSCSFSVPPLHAAYFRENTRSCAWKARARSETGTKRSEEGEARQEGGGGLRLREKLIPNDATRNGKKIFCREVRAPSLPVTISPLPPGPTRNSRENRVHVWTRAARLRTYLVSPVRITAHSYALHPLSPFLPLFFLLFLPPAPVYIYFSPFPHPSNISLALHNGSDLKKRIF